MPHLSLEITQAIDTDFQFLVDDAQQIESWEGSEPENTTWLDMPEGETIDLLERVDDPVKRDTLLEIADGYWEYLTEQYYSSA